MIAQLAATRKRRFLIDPRTSDTLLRWDLCICLILVWTALATPYEVGFLPMTTSFDSPRFIINRAIDALFVADMLLQLFIMFPQGRSRVPNPPPGDQPGPDEQSMHSLLRARETVYEMSTSHRSIALHYMRTWLAVDLISVLTGAIDIVASSTGEVTDEIETLRLFRVLRVLRLIKLVRLLKTNRLLKRWQSAIALDYATQTIVKYATLRLRLGRRPDAPDSRGLRSRAD
jgi:hypothetical protein